MLLSYRRFRRTYLRPLLYLLAFIFFIDATLLVRHRPDTYRSSLKGQRASSTSHTKPSVYIVSVHRNTEPTLRESWNDAILNLADHLGRENVHFTAIESGSQDATKEALNDLKIELDKHGISNSIYLGMTVWEQLEEIESRPPADAPRQPGWIWNSAEKQYEMRRIPYLSRVRNQAMWPLEDMESRGRKFDKVLWINDVVFDTEDIMTLVDTRNGDYAAACSMDFKHPPHYYDTFALRDDMGLKTMSSHWPWFQSPTSRESARRNEPIQVMSCWNGIVVFDAAPFYATPRLMFRGIDDSLADLHLEGSECCLIHADNYLSSTKGVWLNPNVRVGYNTAAYNKVRKARWPGTFWTVAGAWANRFSAWHIGLQSSMEDRVVKRRLEQWAAERPEGQPERYEPGDSCLINEMQIMWSNGWMHL